MCTRRRFLQKSTAGLIFTCLAPSIWRGPVFSNQKRNVNFKPYRAGRTLGEILQVTPDDGFYMNTYYDICPFSPSQRFLALTKIPYQDRITKLGDQAEVVVVDLSEHTIRSVYKTKSWGYQLGANLHWGKSDRYLYTNDVLDGKFAVCVQLDLETGETSAFKRPVYDIDPSSGKVISPHLGFMNNSQYAYGTPSLKPEELDFEKLPDGASDTDGLWETSVTTGKTKLLLTLENVVKQLSGVEKDKGSAYYFFHTKYSPQKDKIMLVVRYPVFTGVRNGAPRYDRNPALLVCKSDGSEIKELVPREKWTGHHPNWHTDNKNIVMNLTRTWKGESIMRFCKINSTNGNIELLSDKFVGSGHPSVDKSGRYLLSDCYPFEPMARDNGEIPIRLIDLYSEEEHAICTVFADLGQKYDIARFWGPSKLDAHPVWSRDYKKVCFNGAPEGKRQVFIAHLEGVI